MLRARTEGCAPLSSRSFAASLSRPVSSPPRLDPEVCVQFPVSRCLRIHQNVRLNTIVIVIPGLDSVRAPSSLALSSGSRTIRMHRTAPENGNRNCDASRFARRRRINFAIDGHANSEKANDKDEKKRLE